MEMLIKIAIGVTSFFGSVCIMFFGWVGLSIIEVKTDTAVTHEKVANIEQRVQQNYDMIAPMFQEFIMERRVADIAVSNASADK